jgi:adenine deaminase
MEKQEREIAAEELQKQMERPKLLEILEIMEQVMNKRSSQI